MKYAGVNMKYTAENKSTKNTNLNKSFLYTNPVFDYMSFSTINNIEIFFTITRS